MQKCHSFFNKITWKIEILKKWKKCLEISSFYSFLPKMTNTWCMVLEIWSVTEKKKFFFILIIFCPFTTLTLKIKIFKKWKKKNTRIYHHFIQVYHKWQSYNIWFLRYEVWQTEFFVILGHALPFYPITTQNINILKKRKNKKKKKKKTPGDMWVPHLKKLLL